jgi:small subunit ribosomal protein S6
MRHYEVTFIVDPVLSGDEVKSAAEHIQNELKGFGATVVAVDEMGLRQLAYQINKRSSGRITIASSSVATVADWLTKFELNLKRDERAYCVFSRSNSTSTASSTTMTSATDGSAKRKKKTKPLPLLLPLKRYLHPR